jgi:hypothetical protein
MLSIESGRGVCFADELVLRRISLQLSDGLASVGERHHLMLALAEAPRAQIADIGFKTTTREGSDTSVAWAPSTLQPVVGDWAIGNAPVMLSRAGRSSGYNIAPLLRQLA